MSAAFRTPGTHPDLDEWKPLDNAHIVKVVDDEDLWYVLAMEAEDVYLLVPADIASKDLHKAAVEPDVELV